MSDCIFCKIVAGELPSARVFEDDDCLAFMDIGPIIKGHTLVIPKAHHDPLIETPDAVLQKVIVVVKRVAAAQIGAFDAEGCNVTQANGSCAGQVVPHLHFHVIPRYSTDGHSWNWNAKAYGSTDEMESYADKLRQALQTA